MRVTGIVTARGGSKGVPRKNLARIGGRSLLAHTAAAALAADCLDRVIVSTDDEEIAEEARRCQLEVPFLRPPELALDETPTLPVVQHAVAWLETNGDLFDAICLLQPTHPFRQPDEIDRCIELMQKRHADCVLTVARVPDHFNPHWTYMMGEGDRLTLATGESAPIARRQDLPPAYHRDGSVYVTRRDVVMIDNSLYGRHVVGLPVDRAVNVNIDTPQDLMNAQRVFDQANSVS